MSEVEWVDGMQYRTKRATPTLRQQPEARRLRVYRQGGCVAQEVPEIPRNARVVDSTSSKTIYLSGETGKRHTLVLEQGLVYRDNEKSMLFEVTQPTQLRHPDHTPLTIGPGNYVMRRTRSFDRPYTERRQQDSGD